MPSSACLNFFHGKIVVLTFMAIVFPQRLEYRIRDLEFEQRDKVFGHLARLPISPLMTN
jgi:hypothetical protein